MDRKPFQSPVLIENVIIPAPSVRKSVKAGKKRFVRAMNMVACFGAKRKNVFFLKYVSMGKVVFMNKFRVMDIVMLWVGKTVLMREQTVLVLLASGV